MFIYVINAAYLLVERIKEDHDQVYDVIGLVLDMLLFFFNCRFAYRELSQVFAFGFFNYFESVWNFIDITLICSIMVSVTFDIMSCVYYYVDFPTMKVIHAYIIFLLFIRLISYARGIKGTSFMIRFFFSLFLLIYLDNKN